ncbi:RDD family protein [Colwellia sp. MEBiC06753]
MNDKIPARSVTDSSLNKSVDHNKGSKAARPSDPTEAHAMSNEETRQILTPFAFEIDKTLFGVPLAKPWRRAIAITFDMFLIAMLSGAPGELLALTFAIVAYRLGNNKRAEKMGKVKGRRRRTIMRAIGAFILFVMLLDVLPKIIAEFDQSASTNDSANVVTAEDLSLSSTIKIAAIVAKVASIKKQSACQSIDCWHGEFNPLLTQIAEVAVKEKIDDLDDVIEGMTEQTNLEAPERQKLHQLLADDLGQQIMAEESASNSGLNKKSSNTKLNKENLGQAITNDVQQQIAKNGIEPTVEQDNSSHSIIEWFKGIINDLGLGFGWAALYFTAFTALWQGQTPGKKLMGIRVIQLDGTPLSVWDSFGRYGGYGAGLATGLLGFLQIIWDPNRQAIQDKISSTVVITSTGNSENQAKL